MALAADRTTKKSERGVWHESIRAITPLVVPLERTWPPFDGRAYQAVFDADGSGVPKRWSWIGPGVAWLVYDNRRGTIDSALQLFGSVRRTI